MGRAKRIRKARMRRRREFASRKEYQVDPVASFVASGLRAFFSTLQERPGRSKEDIDIQIRLERESWDDE